jgi:hypothetical protein
VYRDSVVPKKEYLFGGPPGGLPRSAGNWADAISTQRISIDLEENLEELASLVAELPHVGLVTLHLLGAVIEPVESIYSTFFADGVHFPTLVVRRKLHPHTLASKREDTGCALHVQRLAEQVTDGGEGDLTNSRRGDEDMDLGALLDSHTMKGFEVLGKVDGKCVEVSLVTHQPPTLLLEGGSSFVERYLLAIFQGVEVAKKVMLYGKM